MPTKFVPFVASAALLLALAGCTAGTSTSADSDAPKDEASASASAEAPTNGSKPEFVSSAPAGSPTIAMFGANFTPEQLTIKVGDTVMFTSGDEKIHGLIVAGLSGVTVAKGLPEYYKFTAAGVYTVKDDITSTTMKITVK